MSWAELLEENRVERHRTSAEEQIAPRAVVERNLADAQVDAVSADTRFGCAYEAALVLATAVIAVSGYRSKGAGHHRTVFEALPLAVSGKATREDARYFDRCRRLRNEFSYEAAGVVAARDVADLLSRVFEFRARVRAHVELRFPGTWK
jgi:hypothetical protein